MYGPRGAQVSATIRELAARDWAPTVVCLAPRRGGPHWPDGLPAPATERVSLIRVPALEESLVWRVAARIAPVVRQWPDDKRLWSGRAEAAARHALARAPFAGVVTFAQPWSDHLVGLHLRRTERLPWVAHFSDPWVDSPYQLGRALQRRVWRRMERDVIEAADAVVFVTAEAADLVMRKYPDAWRSKVAVVPHGYDPRALLRPADPNRRPGPLRVVYTGRFYRGVRTPSALFQALAALHRDQSLAGVIEFVFIGPHVQELQSDLAALGLEALVRLEGRRPKRDADLAAADADVLLVVDAPSDGPSAFLPSKLVDYLAFRKPMLGLTPAGGASARLLARLGCPSVQPDDVGAIKAAVAELLGRWRNGAFHVGDSFDAVASEFDIRRTTAQLDEVLVRAFTHAA